MRNAHAQLVYHASVDPQFLALLLAEPAAAARALGLDLAPDDLELIREGLTFYRSGVDLEPTSTWGGVISAAFAASAVPAPVLAPSR